MLVRMACKDTQEVSCLVANLLCELEQPCRACAAEGVVLCGRSPLGEAVTVRYMCAGWYKKDQERAANVRKDTRR